MVGCTLRLAGVLLRRRGAGVVLSVSEASDTSSSSSLELASAPPATNCECSIFLHSHMGVAQTLVLVRSLLEACRAAQL